MNERMKKMIIKTKHINHVKIRNKNKTTKKNNTSHAMPIKWFACVFTCGKSHFMCWFMHFSSKKMLRHFRVCMTKHISLGKKRERNRTESGFIEYYRENQNWKRSTNERTNRFYLRKYHTRLMSKLFKCDWNNKWVIYDISFDGVYTINMFIYSHLTEHECIILWVTHPFHMNHLMDFIFGSHKVIFRLLTHGKRIDLSTWNNVKRKRKKKNKLTLESFFAGIPIISVSFFFQCKFWIVQWHTKQYVIFVNSFRLWFIHSVDDCIYPFDECRFSCHAFAFQMQIVFKMVKLIVTASISSASAFKQTINSTPVFPLCLQSRIHVGAFV